MARNERRSLIISAWPYEAFRENRPNGFYAIEGAPKCARHQKAPCPACKPVAKLYIRRTQEVADIGDDRRIAFPIDDQELAVDLARNTKHFGVLACEGEEPTQEEIDRAYASLDAYLALVLENEDRVYGATKMHYNLSHAQVALNYRGETRNWASDTQPKTACEACGTPNMASAARCMNMQCGAVLHWQIARDRGTLRPDEVAYGLATGKLQRIPGLDPDPELLGVTGGTRPLEPRV